MLPFVDKPDDPLAEAGRAVRLHRVGAERAVTPAIAQRHRLPLLRAAKSAKSAESAASAESRRRCVGCGRSAHTGTSGDLPGRNASTKSALARSTVRRRRCARSRREIHPGPEAAARRTKSASSGSQLDDRSGTGPAAFTGIGE